MIPLPLSSQYSGAVFDLIDKTARELFVTDPEFGRDRGNYGTFDRMPAELQEWWRERALAQMP